jgi:hypothetical protein
MVDIRFVPDWGRRNGMGVHGSRKEQRRGGGQKREPGHEVGFPWPRIRRPIIRLCARILRESVVDGVEVYDGSLGCTG